MSWNGSIQTGVSAGEPDSVQARGKRYPLTRLNDATGQMERVTSFEDQDDLQEAMSMKDANGRDLYSTDAAYRETVKDIIANSPALLAEPTLSRRDVVPTDAEMLQGLREDALKQRRERLTDLAAGGDLEAKYELAKAMMEPEFYEAAREMQSVTESVTPYADYLKVRAAQGLEPERFSIPTEDLPQEKSLEQRAAEMNLDNSFMITTEGN